MGSSQDILSRLSHALWRQGWWEPLEELSAQPEGRVLRKGRRRLTLGLDQDGEPWVEMSNLASGRQRWLLRQPPPKWAKFLQEASRQALASGSDLEASYQELRQPDLALQRQYRPGFPWVTLLLALALLVFLPWGVAYEDLFQVLLTRGANLAYYSGLQPWRWVCSGFLHYHFWHLFPNLVILVFLGRRFEPLIGSGRFLSLAFLSLLITGAANLAGLQGPGLVVGFSGALYGLVGAYLTLRSLLKRRLPRRSWRAFPWLVFLLIAIELGLNIRQAQSEGLDLDLVGHGVGLVLGVLLAPLLVRQGPLRTWEKAVALSCGLLTLLAWGAGVRQARLRPNLASYPRRSFTSEGAYFKLKLPEMFTRVEDELIGPGLTVDIFGGPRLESEAAWELPQDAQALVDDWQANVGEEIVVQRHSNLKIAGRSWCLIFYGSPGRSKQGLVMAISFHHEAWLGVLLAAPGASQTRLLALAEEYLGGVRPIEWSSGYYLGKAVKHLKEGEENLGWRCGQHALKLDPKAKIHPSLRSFFLWMDSQAALSSDPAKSRRLFAQALALVQQRPERKAALLNRRAWALALQGEAHEALPLIQESLQLDSNTHALDTRGRVFYELKRYPEALQDLDQVIELEDWPVSHYHRGLVLQALGRRKEAIQAYHRGLEEEHLFSQDCRARWEKLSR